MRVTLQKVIKWTWHLFAVLMILAAIVIIASRALTPVLNHHLPGFEAWAAKTFQHPVKIERAYFSWSGYAPALTFDRVKILNSQSRSPDLDIRQIKLTFSIFKSLLARDVLLDAISISGVNLAIHEQAQGGFNVAGFYQIAVIDNLTGASLKTNEILSWLCLQPTLVLNEIEIHFIPIKGEEQKIILDKFIFKNSDTAHLIQGKIELQQALSTDLELKINWFGKFDDLPHASANVYLYLEGISLPQWLKQRSFRDWQVTEGIGSAKIWAEWKENNWQDAQSQFQMYDLTFNSPKYKASKSLSRLSGQVFWKREGETQIISGEDILINLPEHLWPTLDFSMTLAPTKGNSAALKSVQVSYLDLADASHWLLGSHLLSDDFNKILSTLNPLGELKQVSVNLPVDAEIKSENITMVSEIHGVSFNAWQGYPGLQNLSGLFNWDGKQGRLQSTSQNLIVTYSSLFELPLKFDQATGDFTLSQNRPDTWVLNGKKLHLINQDLSSGVNFEIDLAAHSSPVVHLNADFSVMHAKNITHYFPMKAFNADLNGWFKQAFHGGQIDSGKVVVAGNWHDFPFDNNNGQFLINMHVKEMEFNFAPNWPMLHKMTGELVFNSKTMTADANSGFIFDVPLKQVHAVMTNVGVAAPTILSITGLVDADLGKGLYFIHHSPLEKKIGNDLGGMKLNGPMQLNLALEVPLAAPAATTVDGKVAVQDIMLTIPVWNLSIKKLSGAFEFTESGIKSDELTGRMLDEDMKLSLSMQSYPDKQPYVRAILKSRINMLALQNWLALPLTKILQGEAAYQAELDLASHSGTWPTHLTVQTNLNGIVVNAPAPYGKPKNATQNFKFDLLMKPNEPMQGKIAYGNLATTAFSSERKNQQFDLIGGEIHLGSGVAAIQPKPGFIITGQLDQFDWNIWKKYIDGLAPAKSKAAPIMADGWRSVDVSINKLNVMGQQLNNIRVTLTGLDDAWQIGLSNQDMNGEVKLPKNYNNHSTVYVQFHRLYIPSSLVSSSKVNPMTLPAISFEGDEVRYGDVDIGHIDLHTTPTANGLEITSLQINSSVSKMHANGNWKQVGNVYQTHLEGDMETDQLNGLLKKWGFESTNLIAKKGSAQFDLNWPDAPYHPTVSAMSGKISIKIGQGRIIDISSSNAAKIGLARVLNILSLESIPRRLSLDFSDLSGKGYNFDYITGGFTLQNGNAYTDDLRVNGPVALITILGRIGFQNKDYNINMNITPFVTSSLPVVVGVFNPIAGVATWVANKMFVSNEISKAATYHYKVTGPWDNPNWQKL